MKLPSMESNPLGPGKRITSLLSGYGQVFFAAHPAVGALFLLATFTVPAQGAAGLIAFMMSNFWARVFGFPKNLIESGFFACNGLLTGLALGLTYTINTAFMVMLMIIAPLGVLIAASLKALFDRYLFVPVLSLPFVVTSWMVLAGGREFYGLIHTLEPYEVTLLSDAFSHAPDLFFHSAGAAFFQLNIPAGILVATGLLLFSRQAFFLAATGLFAGALVYRLLNGDMANLTTGYMGFNFILTSIAVGGMWTVPGPDALLLAVIGSAICAVLVAALSGLLGVLDLPVLAFPFIVTTGVILFALRQRGLCSRFRPVAVPERSPEMNLKRHRNAAARFVGGENPAFGLPVSGQWRITQGFDGPHTHKDLWAHAWDFEIFDERQAPCQGPENERKSYYAYNMPVFAPADGKVVRVVHHVDDNPIGQVNVAQNWGNLVIIWHYGRVYTALCHLKKGSVGVAEGEEVRQGQKIARVGNSGRSPVPHLHFQVQASPEIGAPTLPSELMHYISGDNGAAVYYTHGIPAAGDRIRALDPAGDVLTAASFPLGGFWRFAVRQNGKKREERWETDIDFAGNRFLVCRETGARLRFFVNRKVLILMDYEGPRNGGLYGFYTALPRLPMTGEPVLWHDEMPGELMLSPLARILFDFAEPFAPLAKLSARSKIVRSGHHLSVETRLRLTGPLARSKGGIRGISHFDRFKGLVSLSVIEGNEKRIEINQLANGVINRTDPSNPLSVTA